MLFNSLEFIFFFPLVIAAYFVLPHRLRWMLLLAASYYFYMCWKVEYILLIIASTLIDYYAGIAMSKCTSKAGKRPYLLLSLLTNLGLLFSFKYFNFINDSARELFDHFNIFYDVPAFDVLLPVGISFYTFQTLSYTIDVYKGKTKVEKHLGIFALYVSFFPQLVAGPIERSGNLLPQFSKTHHFDYTRVTHGLKLMAWGFFKKLVIADRLAVYVNEVYNNPGVYGGTTVVIATVFFAFQIYCDFSGYSDIAIGSAKVMGFDLMDNFRRPYFSKSIREFWQRWHISLSTWFRDYLYIPLGGNKVVKWRWYYNLVITFVISGLWHGANWTFVVWGALHGFYLVIAIFCASFNNFLSKSVFSRSAPSVFFSKLFNVGATFILVCFAWIFFRANNVTDAFILIKSIFVPGAMFVNPIIFNDLGGTIEFYISFICIAFLEMVHLIERKESIVTIVSKLNLTFRWAVYIALIMAILFGGIYGEENQFIYFQF